MFVVGLQDVVPTKEMRIIFPQRVVALRLMSNILIYVDNIEEIVRSRPRQTYMG